MPYTPWPINHNSTNSNFQPRPNSHISLLPTLNIPRLLQSTPSKLAINRILMKRELRESAFGVMKSLFQAINTEGSRPLLFNCMLKLKEMKKVK